MAIVERTSSRRITYNNGSPVGVREFHVHPYPTEAAVVALLNGVNLPAKLSGWPITIGFSPAVSLVVYDYEIIRDPNTPEAWTVNVIYRERGDDVLTPNFSPNDAGYVNMRLSVETQFEDAWRQWFTREEQEEDNGPLLDQYYRPLYSPLQDESDIGGRKIDVAGHPSSILRHTQRLQLELTTNRLPRPDTYRRFLGTRNITPFVYSPIGTALFIGADASQVSPGKWQIVFQFNVDWYFHLKQIPRRMLNGHVELDTGFAGQAQTTGQARIVSYIQPFPVVQEFRQLDSGFAGLP